MTNKLHPLQQISFTHANQAYVVEASAGTGKTWTIERLFIKALLEATQPDNLLIPLAIENILVVTFTNDATDELKQRISEQIQTTINQIIYLNNQFEQEQIPATNQDIFLEYLLARQTNSAVNLRKKLFLQDLTLLTRALQNFDQAAIYTIHGFCNRILQDYQFECQTPTEFELLASKTQLIDELVLDFMRREIINNSIFSSQLELVMNNLEGLFRSNDYQLALAERISAKLPKDLFKLEAAEYRVKYQLNVTPSLQGLTQSELSGEEQRQVKAEFLAYLIDYLAQHYPLACAKLNALSYDELIQKVADSVERVPALADKIFQHFPLAFIDEFQDTDALQWQIFSTIYHLAAQKRGNVVVVGDPKQAIYRFRGADVDTYLEARSQIGNQLELSDNYRSQPEIMNFINQLFDLNNQRSVLETNAVDLTQSFLGNSINYTAVNACGSSKLILPSPEQLQALALEAGVNQAFYAQAVQLVAITGKTATERSQKLLAAMSLEILALLKADSGLKGKIAILVTKNREASEIVNYLRKFGVKAAELKLGNIFATTSAADLYLILSAIADLANRHNFMRALSSQVFNLELTFLATNTQENNPQLEFWYKQFFAYKGIWERKGIFSLIYALLEDVVSRHAAAQATLSNRELANLWQLAELLNKQASKLHNQSELLYWFKQKISTAETQLGGDLEGNNEELVRLDNDDEQIIITTQHKAKGLEYEVLFCPYFKSGIQLDGTYDFNYHRPFFSNFRSQGQSHAELILDPITGQQIVANDNTEAQRLNYVALTRAKSRLYIYLKEPTKTKTGGYNSMQRPDKLVELFGYTAKSAQDVSHRLFNYPEFFAANPLNALKDLSLFPGVIAYQRNEISPQDLQALHYNSVTHSTNTSNFNYVNPQLAITASYVRQSYSGLTAHNSDDFMASSDYFVKNEVAAEVALSYRYSILSDGKLKGAVFGVLFHELCENYPFSQPQLTKLLQQANLELTNNDYVEQLTSMLDEAFAYPLLDGRSLNDFNPKLHELDFNLTIHDPISLREQVVELLAKHFGVEHPFTLACQSLERIESGFLVGFIDLFFEHQGKYWVLDYKTNRLNNYATADNHTLTENSLLDSLAEHHYYLQYLLYLVAVKRYLEQRLGLDDASDLIGGAVYFYVRGIYTTTTQDGDGVYLDRNCQRLVAELDQLFKGAQHG